MNQFAKLLEKLSEKLGTTVEQMYGVLIKQARIEVIKLNMRMLYNTAVALFSALACRYGYINTDIHAEWWILVAFSILSIGACIYCIIENIGKSITCSKNPEYFALQEIFETISGNSE